LSLLGAFLLIRPYIPWPALLIKNGEKTVVIGDLHLGYEFELTESGINLPSQTGKIREKLISLLKKVKADRLIILGDFKHSIPKISLQEWKDIPDFLDEVEKNVSSILIVPGNHDGGLSSIVSPQNVKIVSRRGIIVGGKEKIGLFHGHTWPSPKLFEAKTWVIGHNHPTIQFKSFFGFKVSKPIWVKAPINKHKLIESFLKHRNVKVEGKKSLEKVLREKYGVKAECSNLIILPAFNELLGGLPFNVKKQDELLGPILRSRGVILEKAEVFLLDGTYLGFLKDLKNPS